MPRLLLLTGPAAGDVAAVLSDGCRAPEVERAMERFWDKAADLGKLIRRDPAWWDEVRDYEQAPRSISDQFCGTRTTTASGIQAAARRVSATDAAIRSLPGGEKWLIGLVLPEPLNTYSDEILGLNRQDQLMPARLAILAPEPPPLLVERVRAWGGEVWICQIEPGGERFHDPHDTVYACITVHGGHSVTRDTWHEAVRAALGEAKPQPLNSWVCPFCGYGGWEGELIPLEDGIPCPQCPPHWRKAMRQVRL